MQQVASLDSDLRDRGLTALMVLVLAQHETTAELSTRKEMTTANGTVVRGVAAAEEVLLETLRADSSGWSDWMNDPLHVNASASMVSVLSADARRQLAPPLQEVFRSHAMYRATTRAIARDLARSESTPRPEVIDIAAAERRLAQHRTSH